MNLDIPKDKNFPADCVQCNECGGNGCQICDDRGWFVPENHPQGRRCRYLECNKPLHPTHIAVYCSNECANDDA